MPFFRRESSVMILLVSSSPRPPWSHGHGTGGPRRPISFGRRRGGLAFRNVWRTWTDMDGIPLLLLLAARATLQSTVVLPFVFSGCPRARWKSKSAIHKAVRSGWFLPWLYVEIFSPGNLGKRLNFSCLIWQDSSSKVACHFFFQETRCISHSS